jgi:hypothetical protein
MASFSGITERGIDQTIAELVAENHAKAGAVDHAADAQHLPAWQILPRDFRHQIGLVGDNEDKGGGSIKRNLPADIGHHIVIDKGLHHAPGVVDFLEFVHLLFCRPGTRRDDNGVGVFQIRIVVRRHGFDLMEVVVLVRRFQRQRVANIEQQAFILVRLP